jgi:hypothetical protein
MLASINQPENRGDSTRVPSPSTNASTKRGTLVPEEISPDKQDAEPQDLDVPSEAAEAVAGGGVQNVMKKLDQGDIVQNLK